MVGEALCVINTYCFRNLQRSERLSCCVAHTFPVRCRKDLVEELTKPIWWIDRKGEIPAGKAEAYQQPIFQYHDVSPSFRWFLGFTLGGTGTLSKNSLADNFHDLCSRGLPGFFKVFTNKLDPHILDLAKLAK